MLVKYNLKAATLVLQFSNVAGMSWVLSAKEG